MVLPPASPLPRLPVPPSSGTLACQPISPLSCPLVPAALAPQRLGPCTAPQPLIYPATVETWAQVRAENAAWAAAIPTPGWQSHGTSIRQLGRLRLSCIHDSGINVPWHRDHNPFGVFSHSGLGVIGLWKGLTFPGWVTAS